jgi:hypothetical protein
MVMHLPFGRSYRGVARKAAATDDFLRPARPTWLFAANMKLSHLLLTLLGGFPLITVACADSPNVGPMGNGNAGAATSETLPAIRDAASFCAALCDRQQDCDNGLDVQTCKNDCKNRQAAVFPKLRADVVELIASCFAQKDCKSVLAGEVITECAAEGVASVAPSDTAIAYCAAYEKAKKKCGSSAVKATCLEQAKLYSDDTIDEAANCNSRPCGEIDTCVGASFGGFGSTPKGSPTTTCSESTFADLGTCAECAAGACCEEATACASDATCRALMSYCSAGRGDTSACSFQLQQSSTSTQQRFQAYFECAANGCASDCGPAVVP